MTVDEVNQLIDNEIYENNEGHITGTILSAVLHELNNKKIAVSAIDSSFVSAFLISAASSFCIAGLPEDGAQAFVSAIFGNAIRELRNGNSCDDMASGLAGNIHNLTTAIMNDMGYQYTSYFPHNFAMFESAIMNVIEKGKSFHFLKLLGFETGLHNTWAETFMTAIFHSAMCQMTSGIYELKMANIQGFVSAIVDELLMNQIAMQKLSSGLSSY